MLEQAAHERFLFRRELVPEGAGDMARDRIDQDHGRKFAAGEDVVADGELKIDAVFNEPLVDTFVAAANEDQARVLREPPDDGIREAHALGRHEDDVAGRFGERLDVLERGIEDIECITPDQAGVARGKMMPSKKFTSNTSLALPSAVFMTTISGGYPENGNGFSYPEDDGDLKLMPDLSTLTLVPWEEDPTAAVICDLVHQDGRTVDFTRRTTPSSSKSRPVTRVFSIPSSFVSTLVMRMVVFGSLGGVGTSSLPCHHAHFLHGLRQLTPQPISSPIRVVAPSRRFHERSRRA